MKIKQLTAAILMIILWVGPLSYAGDAGRESLFSVGIGARAIGMGGGFTALSADGSSIYYNPAGLSYLEYQEFNAMHSILFEETDLNFVSWVYPMHEMAGLGVGFARIGTTDILRVQDYEEIGKFDFSTSEFFLSYGQRVHKSLGLGLSLKILNQSFDKSSEYGVGLDAGIRSQLTEFLSVGAASRDLIRPELKLDSTSEEIPRSLSLGLALEKIKIEENAMLSASFDLVKSDHRDWRVNTGAEVSVYNAIAFRAGYDRENLSFGAGFTKGRVTIDYAYKVLDFLDDIHHFSFILKLGKLVSDRNKPVVIIPVTKPLSPKELKIKELSERANHFFHHFELDSAAYYFQQVIEIDSTNTEAITTHRAIENARQIETEKEGQIRDAQLEVQQYLRTFYTRAQLFYIRKNYNAAIDFINLILDIDPQESEAIALKNEIISAKNNEITVLMDSARTFETQDEVVRAIEVYNRVLELDEKNTVAGDARKLLVDKLDVTQQLNLGISLYKRGRYIAARARFEQVLAIQPDQEVAREYLIKIQDSLSPAKLEISTLEDIQKNAQAWQYYTNGLRFMRDQQYQKAIDEWNKVLKIYPNNENTLNNIEQARLRLDTE